MIIGPNDYGGQVFSGLLRLDSSKVNELKNSRIQECCDAYLGAKLLVLLEFFATRRSSGVRSCRSSGVAEWGRGFALSGWIHPLSYDEEFNSASSRLLLNS